MYYEITCDALEATIICLQSEPELMGQFEFRPAVKLARERYVKPSFPPTLNWIPVYNQNQRVGELLSAFEFIHVLRKVHY